MFKRFVCFIVVLVGLCSVSIAQTATTGQGTKKSDINFTKAAKKYKKQSRKHRCVVRQKPANQTPMHVYTPKKMTHEDSMRIHRIKRDTIHD